jgi:TRAP-type mannitol/chloroaromatic compound transport system substrate-binding protein
MSQSSLKTLAARLAAAALAAGLAGTVAAQQPAGPRNLKMQSTWPASLTLQDNFRFFAERVDKLTAAS